MVKEDGSPGMLTLQPSKADLLSIAYQSERLTAAMQEGSKACGPPRRLKSCDEALAVNAKNRRTFLADSRRKRRNSMSR